MEIKSLLENAGKNGISDLHISTGMPPIVRIDGELKIIEDAEIFDAQTAKNFIYPMMSDLQQKIFEEDLELDFGVEIADIANFRVNAFYQRQGMAAVLRIIPKKIPTLDELEFPDVFKELLTLSHGLILVTGPAGSGKSTTLAAMIDYLNTNSAKHIITIEDPIEFIYQSKKSLITQRQVRKDTKNFTTALRSALREDPDVILVGELRDLETIRLALTAAETGHLVMATLHTSSAPRSINRMIDVFPAGEKNSIRNILSESLQAVICQKLLKQEPQGRIAAFEIMVATSAIRNLIREDKIVQMYSVIQTSSEKSMCTLDQYLKQLVSSGKIKKETAKEVATNKELFIN